MSHWNIFIQYSQKCHSHLLELRPDTLTKSKNNRCHEDQDYLFSSKSPGICFIHFTLDFVSSHSGLPGTYLFLS